jgi:hypothetical protein
MRLNKQVGKDLAQLHENDEQIEPNFAPMNQPDVAYVDISNSLQRPIESEYAKQYLVNFRLF